MRRRLTFGMIAALFLAFFTFAAASVVSKDIFERLPHLEDEFAYLYQAKIFAGGHAWVLRNEPVKVFWQPFVIQPETSPDGVLKRFAKYTPGWPLLLTLGVLLGQPWIMNAVLGMLCVVIVYRLGREIFDETVGVVSALLLAISPMALMLNATLMSHVPAMFMAEVFVYGYWRMTRHGKRRYAWAALSGLALGLMLSTRPLSAAAIAAPVVLHAVSRLIDAEFNKQFPIRFLPALKPLLVLSIFVVPTAALWPISNQVWTGDWRTNTYTLLWSYDTPGFGPDHGLMAGGHTLEYGWRNARADMEWYLRDLFGWSMSPQINKYITDNLGWGAGVGLSWIVVIAGLIYGRKNEWIWLFFELFVAIVIAQMTYWIGSVVYGTAAYSLRYWYEATFGVCLVAGYGIVAWARSLSRPPVAVVSVAQNVKKTGELTIAYLNGLVPNFKVEVPVRAPNFAQRLSQLWNRLWPGYIILLIAVGFSLIGYTPARFHESLADWPNGLFRYNKVGQNQLDAINAMRQKYGAPSQKVLIVILRNPNPAIEDNWRDYGAAMAVTSPYLDSDIIVARIFEPPDAPDFVQRFPDRLVLYQIGETLYPSIDAANAGATAQNKANSDKSDSSANN